MRKFLSCIPPAFNGALYPMYQVSVLILLLGNIHVTGTCCCERFRGVTEKSKLGHHCVLQVGIVLPKDTLWVVTCRDVYPVWGVETFVTPHGPMIAAFREGVASIVTNRGVPRASSDPLHVLQLSANYTKQELRRAYLRESQKWHPDKWMDVPGNLGNQFVAASSRVGTLK